MEQIQEDVNNPKTKITRAAMEEVLGDAYKRCWAFAFKYANEELDYDMQIEKLCREFDLFKPQAEWFVNGANAILFQKEIQETRQASQSKQREKTEPKDNSKKQSVKYVSQLEMMSFLEDIEEMSNNVEFAEFWGELNELKQTVQQQQCATEREVLKIFRIHTVVQRAREEEQRFFDAYPVTTDAWENGHFNVAGEVVFN
jgi:hypothetical protein